MSELVENNLKKLGQFFLHGFTLFPLISGHCASSGVKRINEFYSTMSDRIVEGIFPHSPQNLPKVWRHFKRLQQHGREFCNETQLLENLARLFLFLFWSTARISTTVRSSDLQRHRCSYILCNAMSLNCYFTVCVQQYLLGLLENSRVYIPSLFTDCLKWNSIPMILGSAFLNVAVIRRHNRTILRKCVFREDQNKAIKNSVALFWQDISFKKVAKDKSSSLSLV